MPAPAPMKIETADIGSIIEALPQRYPFVLIDKVVDIRSDFSGTGIKHVTINEPQFLGHFPGRPIYPGVMIIEGMAQTAGVISILSTEVHRRPKAVDFVTIDKCKFRQTAKPGDILHYHMRVIDRQGDMWWFHGDAKIDGKIIAQADIGAMFVADVSNC